MKSKTRPLFVVSTLPLRNSSLFKRAALTISMGALTLNVHAATWLNTGTTDWNTASNWNPSGVPNGVEAVIITNTDSIATISANPTTNPGDVIVGNGSGTTGLLRHTAGTYTTGSWVKIGHNSGSGVYNVAGTGTGGTFTGLSQGTGGFAISGGGQLRVGGGDAGTGSTGTLNVNTSGTVAVGSALHVGTQTSTGTLNIDNGTVTVNNSIYIGNGAVGGAGVTGTLRMSGGSLTKTGGGDFRIGSEAAKGFVTVSGGTLTNNNELQIGDGAGTQGTLTLSAGTINTGSWVSIGRSTGTGTMNVSGGTLTKTGGGSSFIVGDGSTGTLTQTNGAIVTNGQFWVASNTSTGNYNMSGGTLSADDWFVVGRNGGSTGTLTMTGGTITKGGANDFVVGSDGGTASGTVNFSGGLINVTGGATNIGKSDGVGTLTMSGTSDFRTSQLIVGVGSGVGTVNLNGGTLKTPKLIGGAGTSTVHFNGGTIAATADTPNLISNLGTADILGGGALFDTQAFTASASQIFSGTGTLTKLGTGTLTLTGNSTHTGLTQVSDGKLVVNTRSHAALGSFSVANGKTLGVTRRFPEETLNAASLTLGTAPGATTLEMNLGNFGNPLSGVATLNVLGTLTVNANTTVNVTDSFPEVGSFPLIQFGTRTGSGTITLGSLPPGVVANLDATIDPNAIYLVITQAKLLEWDDSELSGGVWNTTNSNWNDVLTFSPAAFTTGAPVSFLDLGTVDSINPPNPDVVIAAGGVSPGAVTFNNSSLNYSITGTGGINGTASLLKQGTGTATLGTTNAYTGITRIEGGVLSVASIANGGSPSGIGASPADSANLVFAGGTLRYTGAGHTSNRGFNVVANSVFDVQGPLTMSGGVNASAGGLTKAGAGVLTLSHPGANLLSTGADFIIDAGGVILSGSGTQTNSVNGSLRIGTALAATSDFTLNNTALTCTSFFDLARGSGTPGAVSTCTLTGSTVNAGNLSMGYDNAVVGYSTTSLLTLNGSSFTTGLSRIGESTGAIATVVLNGASTMNAVTTNVAQSTGTTATLSVKGTSVYTSSNRIQIGSDAGASGTVTIENSASVSTTSYLSVGFNGGGALTVKNSGSLTIGNDFSVNENGAVPATATLQDTGTITVAGTTYVGRNATRVGTFTQTGGTLNSNGGEFQIGKYGQGTWLQSAGITNAAGWISIGRETGGTGVLSVSGTGSFTQTTPGAGMNIGENGTGTLNILGTATVSSLGAGGVVVTRVGGVGTVNLDGGTFVAMKIVDDGGNSTFHFNGGVLKAAIGANLAFMSGLDTVDVKSGGAFIDSNGQTIAIAQAITDGGGGGLTKSGAGMLQLNAVNTYTGATVVSAGSLGGTGSVAGTLSVAAAGAIAPGAGGVGTFTAGNTTISGTFACDVDGATADLLVAGTLNVSGATLTVNAINPLAGPTVIATSTSAVVGTFASVPSGYSVNYTGNKITLTPPAGTPYSTWAAANITAINPAANATPGGDPDNDGRTNLAEFGLNGNPLSGASAGKVASKVANVGGVPSLVLSIPVRGPSATNPTFSGATEKVSTTTDGIIYHAQASATLGLWNTAVTEVTGTDKTTIESTLPALDAGWFYRTFTTGPVSGVPTRFLRAVIEQP